MEKDKTPVKLIAQDLVANPRAVDRFHREVQAAARLSHPNIVTAHDAERVGDLHLLVMEYVDGTDLAQVVAERGPLPVAQACSFVQQAASGLQQAHEQGLVHLGGICAVAGLGGKPYRDGSYEYYVSEKVIANEYKGVGPFIMASLEMERMGDR